MRVRLAKKVKPTIMTIVACVLVWSGFENNALNTKSGWLIAIVLVLVTFVMNSVATKKLNEAKIELISKRMNKNLYIIEWIIVITWIIALFVFGESALEWEVYVGNSSISVGHLVIAAIVELQLYRLW